LRFDLSPDGVDPAIGPSRSVGPHGIVTEEADEFVYVGLLEGSQELSYDLLCGIAHAEVLLKLCASQPKAEYTASLGFSDSRCFCSFLTDLRWSEEASADPV
jgi:hypothetical protein